MRALQQHPYALVLLDLLMPKVDGFQVLKTMRSQEGMRSIPVIVVSNINSKDDLEKIRSMGVSTFIVKALSTPQAIVEEVQKTLGDRKASTAGEAL